MATRQPPPDILDDLCSRFIINIPAEERKDPIRLCFQVELAYWFYLDFYCPENPSYPQCTMKEFTQMVFQHVPFLRDHLANLDDHRELERVQNGCANVRCDTAR